VGEELQNFSAVPPESVVMEIFGSSGVRGVANEYLNPEFVCQIAQAAGSV